MRRIMFLILVASAGGKSIDSIVATGDDYAMVEKSAETLPRSPEEDQADLNKRGCPAFRTLKHWQADQYRIAVEENRWYLGERLGRHVDWEEAETDFLHNGYYGCAPKWRRHFCASKCTHFTSCDLGQYFCLDN